MHVSTACQCLQCEMQSLSTCMQYNSTDASNVKWEVLDFEGFKLHEHVSLVVILRSLRVVAITNIH